MSDDGDVQRTLGRIEGKLDALAINLTGHTAQDELRFAALDKKLEALQQSKWFNSGVSATVSSFVTFAVLWLKGH